MEKDGRLSFSFLFLGCLGSAPYSLLARDGQHKQDTERKRDLCDCGITTSFILARAGAQSYHIAGWSCVFLAGMFCFRVPLSILSLSLSSSYVLLFFLAWTRSLLVLLPVFLALSLSSSSAVSGPPFCLFDWIPALWAFISWNRGREGGKLARLKSRWPINRKKPGGTAVTNIPRLL